MYGNPYYEPYQDDNALEHFGVLGMKWGVRRYQNKDGTLTAAGKQRAKKEKTPEEKAKSEERKQKAIKAAKIGAAVLGTAASVAITGVSLDAAFNSGAGLKAIKKGSTVLSYGLAHEGSKLVSQLGSALNVQDTGWSQATPSRAAQRLTQEMRTAGAIANQIERRQRRASRFIG